MVQATRAKHPEWGRAVQGTAVSRLQGQLPLPLACPTRMGEPSPTHLQRHQETRQLHSERGRA